MACTRTRGACSKSCTTAAATVSSALRLTWPSPAEKVVGDWPSTLTPPEGLTTACAVSAPIRAEARIASRRQEESEVKVPWKPGVRFRGVPPAKGTL